MKLDIYVNYLGTCEEAFRFYAEHLGGRITAMVRHGELPESTVPAEWAENVAHARIEIGGAVLMGADIPNCEPMRSAYVVLGFDEEAEAERVHGLLTDGGEVFMEMKQTPFANRFAMLRDRFGTSWMLLHQPASSQGGAA